MDLVMGFPFEGNVDGKTKGRM